MKGYINIAEGSDKKIASHSFTEDAETKHVERVAPGCGVLTLPGTPQVEEQNSTGTYPASPVDITGMAGISVKSSFSVDEETCKLKVQFHDSAGEIIGISDEYTIPNTSVADGSPSRYIGGMLLLDNQLLGASGVRFIITEAPATGNVSLSVAGV